jgi:hypothetical protein
MNALTIQIADIPVTLELDECTPIARTRIIEHYDAFTVPLQSNALTIHIQSEPGDPFVPLNISPIFYIRTTRHNGRIDFESYFERGWIDRTENRGTLVLRPLGETENFLRVLYAWLCVEQSALLIHAAGIIRNNRGYVFFGPSGNGKTTISRLSMEDTVLSDDLVIVKKQNAAWRVFGVPFRGDFPEAPRTNATAELAGIFALAKDDQHYLVPLSPVEAVARLAACVPFVMAQPNVAHRVIEICSDLVRCVPAQTLHFARDNEFWKVIDGFTKVPHPA